MVTPDKRPHPAAAPLALACTALVLYASLYPFTGWRWPPGVSLGALLALPWPPWRVPFDVVSNVLGYVPLGMLFYLLPAGRERPWWRCALMALAAAALLSYAMEVLQQFVPGRVPSRVDWALNCGGAAAGAALAALLHASGWLRRWQDAHARWFVVDAAWGLGLIALWPIGQLFPSPLPLGLGHVPADFVRALADVFAGVPWAQGLHDALADFGPATQPLSPLAEAAAQTLGLLAPCLVVCCVATSRRRRLLLTPVVLAAGLLVTTVSTALSVGPAHALAWVTPTSLPALSVGLLLAAACVGLAPRAAAACGLVVLVALVLLINQAPADPYFAASLHGWEQGRFVRFHGVAQWIGWLWPYAALLWLALRLQGPARSGR